jgi:hypothetical protein
MPSPTAIFGDFSGKPKKKKKIDPAIGGGRDPPQWPRERDLATLSGHFCLSGEQKKKKKKKKKLATQTQSKKSFLMPQK